MPVIANAPVPLPPAGPPPSPDARYFDHVARGETLAREAARALEREVIAGRRGLGNIHVDHLQRAGQLANEARTAFDHAEQLLATGKATAWNRASLYVAEATMNLDLGTQDLKNAMKLMESGIDKLDTQPEQNQLLGALGGAASMYEGARYLADEAPRTPDDWNAPPAPKPPA
jgi:hypothetical protein